jgi:hypothetical protein
MVHFRFYLYNLTLIGSAARLAKGVFVQITIAIEQSLLTRL